MESEKSTEAKVETNFSDSEIFFPFDQAKPEKRWIDY